MKKVMTIAGSDCSGGAGIQADIKTMTAHKVYAMSVITALTAKNTTGVYGVLDAGADFWVSRWTLCSRTFFRMLSRLASGCISAHPLVETITGSTTIFFALYSFNFAAII